jgi:hypothetical protein
MRRTFAHHFSGQLKIDENHMINLGSLLRASMVRMSRRKSFGAVALNQLSLSKSRLVSKKPRRLGNCSHKTTGEIAAMVQCRVSFFKDLVSSDGRLSSCLQQSIEISGAENVTSAVEEAKRHYERLRRVPIWSLCADRLELESEGKRTSYRPTHDESALIPIPGRRNAVSDFAIRS